jgi:hypothetical protein
MIKTIEMTEAIIEAKFSKGASWADISKAAGMSEVFVVSACLGQNTLPAEAAAKLVRYLDLGNRAKDVEIALQRHHAAPCRPNQTSSDVGMIGMITARRTGDAMEPGENSSMISRARACGRACKQRDERRSARQ